MGVQTHPFAFFLSFGPPSLFSCMLACMDTSVVHASPCTFGLQSIYSVLQKLLRRAFPIPSIHRMIEDRASVSSHSLCSSPVCPTCCPPISSTICRPRCRLLSLQPSPVCTPPRVSCHFVCMFTSCPIFRQTHNQTFLHPPYHCPLEDLTGPPPPFWILNVLVDATRHRWRNRNGGPQQRLSGPSLKEREGKGSKPRSATRAAGCRREQQIQGDIPPPPPLFPHFGAGTTAVCEPEL